MAVRHIIDPCGCACGGEKVSILAAFAAHYIGWTDAYFNKREDWPSEVTVCYHGEALHDVWEHPTDCTYGITVPDIWCKKTILQEWHWEWWEFGEGVGTPQVWDYSTELVEEYKWLNGTFSQSSNTTGEEPPSGIFSELCPGEDLVEVVEDSDSRLEWTEYGSDPPWAIPFGSISYRCTVTMEEPHTWSEFEADCATLYASLDTAEMVSEYRQHFQPCIHVYHDEDGSITRHAASGWTEEPPGTAGFTSHQDGFYYSGAYFVDDVPNKVSKMFWVQNRFAVSVLNGLISGRFRGTKIAAPISATDDQDVEVDPWNPYLPPGWVPTIPSWPPAAVSYNDPPDVLWWQKVPTLWDVVSGATLYVSDCAWDLCTESLGVTVESTIEVPADEYLGLEADQHHVMMVKEDMHHDDCGDFQAF